MNDSKWVVVMILILSAKLGATADEPRVSQLGCPEKCGDITIPYPFGIGDECSYDEDFNITCDQTFPHSPKPIYGENFEVLSIDVLDAQIRTFNNVSRYCYNGSMAELTPYPYRIITWVTIPKFAINSTQNILAAIGCDAYAWFTGTQSLNRHKVRLKRESDPRSIWDYGTGCATQCYSLEDVDNGTCSSGAGCCQAQIPEGIHNITILAGTTFNYTRTPKVITPCTSAFVVAKDSFSFTLANLTMTSDQMPKMLPVVYDWTIGNETCQVAQESGDCLCCKGRGCECLDSNLGGYRCNCSLGYSGNPYLQNGCQDIDECSLGNDDCKQPATCVNTKGSYYCRCPEGYQGNGTSLRPCLPVQNNYQIKIILGLSIVLGMILLVFGVSLLIMVIQKRKAIKQKAKNFERNGGLLLQQQMSSDKTIVERIRILTIDELEQATNHFSAHRILGEGGQGTVYKGMLDGGRIVAIKKFRAVDGSKRKEFINEIVILSQISHRNIVKLLGCCLETEVPVLVYEFIPNGTLFRQIHYPSEEFPITWKMRLQIAADSSSALAYLHSSSTTPIFHRDVKSSNILLDEKYRAKLSDFGISRSVAVDQTHLTTRLVGTLGYMDPEYFQSGQFTEKSDVYSFGVVLVELLTGEKAVRSTPQEDKSLTSWFLSHMEYDCFFDIVDSPVSQEASKEELLMAANIAVKCLNLNGKQRPTMQQVLAEIEAIRSLYASRVNKREEPKKEKVLTKRTHRISRDIIAGFSTSTLNLRSRSMDSAELSLLFSPR